MYCQYSAIDVNHCPRHGRCEWADVESNVCEYDEKCREDEINDDDNEEGEPSYNY